MASPDPVAERSLHERIPTEALRLVEAASARSLTLRLTGSLAVWQHCPGDSALLDALGRRLLRDIDFWGYAKQQRDFERLFEGDGYTADPTIKQAHEWGVKRLIYLHPETQVKIDVFMDELVMAHTIDFKGRLELDHVTIDLADLLLSKLQIHEITENDLIDIAVVVGEHEFGTGDRERIDLGRIVDIMKSDWGFCYTTLENISKCETALERFSKLPPGVADTVRERLVTMRERIESASKTTRWKIRARVGTRSRWYQEVDEVDR